MKILKQCSKCKKWKELNEFHKNKRSKDGHYCSCKECGKKYHEKNREKRIKYLREYYKKNKELTKEKRNKDAGIYYRKNKELILEKNKKHNNSCALFSVYEKQIELYEKIKQNDVFLEVKCAYCGRWFKPTNREIRSRLNVINGLTHGEKRLYCSDNCKNECPIFNQKKWPRGYKKATSREVQPELRQMVLARDNYTCQKCGSQTSLHCHHIEGILWEPLQSADIDMCITYCKTCHKKVHQIEGCGYQDMRCNKKDISYE